MTDICAYCDGEFGEDDTCSACEEKQNAEMESHRAEWAREQHASKLTEDMREAYEPGSAKHPDFASVLNRADDLRKRGRGE